MADYSREHERALRVMQRKGAAITFPALSDSAEDYNAAEGTWQEGGEGGGQGAVSGYAVEKPLEPEEYYPETLVQANSTLLVFVPVTYGEFPVTGQMPMWAGKTRTVKEVWPIRPAEVAIAARVALA